MQIGELTAKAGVNSETVRFYERKGLLPRPLRQPSGYRLYDEETLKRLRFIKGAQVIGFTLREVRELMELRVGPGRTCSDVKDRVEERLQDVNAKLRHLRSMKKAMQRLTAMCADEQLSGECPIVAALDENGARLLK